MHEGHRERLRNKLLSSPRSLEPHEVLEVLLFYAIPRKNTNEIAHELLNRFDGSLRRIFDADMEMLKSVNGIGENTASFLKTISKVLDIVSIETPIIDKIACPMDAYKIVKPLFANATKELFVIFYLNAEHKVLGKSILSSDSRDYVNLDLQEINRLILIHKPKSVLVAHNHISESLKPSSADNDVTKRIALLLHLAEVNFYDHFIFCGEKFYSYHLEGVLAKINSEINLLLNSRG